jgi:hypothetical protein
MNASELAQAMLLWEQKRRELDMLEAEIKAAVLAIGKTQTVGSVRASYSAGRKSYFRSACLGLGIKNVPYMQSGPSVTVKLQD